MNGPDGLRQENAALRERISKLSAAILRISASLDLDTVLREVVDSARALTGARYGMIATVDAAGVIQEFIAPGLSADERRHMAEWPHGYQFFEHLQNLPGALRLADVPAYIRSLGYSEELTLSKTLQATPMRHRGSMSATSFSARRRAGGSSRTRTRRSWCCSPRRRRWRSPTPARTATSSGPGPTWKPWSIPLRSGWWSSMPGPGRPVSFNREARRIVGGLRSPDSPPEQLLEVMICRRSDGREVRLDELPLADELRNAETVRAEEIELSVPDGRSVTTLVNSTPILSADGAVESVVVTMQDLAPLEELERLRAEFLGMVSHELRTPLTSIKGSAATVLNARPELDPAEMREFFRIIDEQADHMRGA